MYEIGGSGGRIERARGCACANPRACVRVEFVGTYVAFTALLGELHVELPAVELAALVLLEEGLRDVGIAALEDEDGLGGRLEHLDHLAHARKCFHHLRHILSAFESLDQQEPCGVRRGRPLEWQAFHQLKASETKERQRRMRVNMFQRVGPRAIEQKNQYVWYMIDEEQNGLYSARACKGNSGAPNWMHGTRT